MKKIVTFLLTLTLFASMSLSAFATSGTFVPSITQKGAPQVVTTGDKTEDGVDIIAIVIDKNTGEVVYRVPVGSFIITALTELDNASHLTKEDIELLRTIYKEFSEGTKTLSETTEELNKLVQKYFNGEKTADDLVIKDLFDLTVVSEELANYLAQEDTRLILTFDMNLEPGQFVTIMTFKNNEWVIAEDIVNNGDGTVTAAFKNFCPVMVLVEGAEADAPAVSEPPAEDTVETMDPVESDTSAAFPWWIILIIAVIAIVAVVAAKTRKKESK